MSKNKFKKGAASFYVVAFSTLILVILATSFAVAIIAEVARSSDDDLAQSAYDSALAGVEDAKLAFVTYKSCLKSNADGCSNIISIMENSDSSKSDCDMVANILGRYEEGKTEGEVIVDADLNQAYTCAKIQTKLSDYRATLNSANPYKAVRARLDGGAAKDVASVKISWFMNDGIKKANYANFENNQVVFKSLNETEAVPPTLAVELVQAASGYTAETLNQKTTDGQTDRATVFLVPTDNAEAAGTSNTSYVGVYNDGSNVVTDEQVASTNNHAKNLPFVVYCGDASTEFMCSATLELPEPIGGDRDNEAFMFVVYLPYEQPDTDFVMEFMDSDGRIIGLDSMQVLIDSTGRANDIFRRVEVRLEPEDESAFPLYAVYAGSVEKALTVTSEYGNYDGYFDNPNNY